MTNENNMREDIEQVKEEKDLGVLINEQLAVKNHINEKVKVANRNLGIIKRTFTYLDKQIFLNLYKANVRPHLEYASTVWSPHLIKHKRTNENVQRRATKLIPSLGHLPYSERLIKLDYQPSNIVESERPCFRPSRYYTNMILPQNQSFSQEILQLELEETI